MHRAPLAVALVWITSLLVSSQTPLAPSAMRAHPAIGYATSPANDPAHRLNQRLDRGELTFTYRPVNGYLESALEAFDIPVSSQVLVFSKTSFQAAKIGPANPRSIYFNDTTSVGWVRGGEVLEVVTQDPRQGAMFYTLANVPDGRPRFSKNMVCVQCHTSDATMNVPGWFLGSVYPGPDGTAMYGPTYMTDHRTPFAVRWGGWYVNGRHRLPRHIGNSVFPEVADQLDPTSLYAETLEGRFEMTGFLSPHSDIVALMLLEHQSRMLSLITRVGWEARLGAAESGRPLADAARELVDYLLFVNEAPMAGPIAGPTRFADTFSARGPRDRQGRSLRDFDLRTRLMRYPCSYEIYSEAFDGMPAAAKAAVYSRLWRVLSGAETDAVYSRLAPEDRAAVIDILRQTKPDLPAYFQPITASR